MGVCVRGRSGNGEWQHKKVANNAKPCDLTPSKLAPRLPHVYEKYFFPLFYSFIPQPVRGGGGNEKKLDNTNSNDDDDDDADDDDDSNSSSNNNNIY